MKNSNQNSADQEFYLPVRIEDTSSILNVDNATLMPYNEKVIIVDTAQGPKIVNFCSDVYGLVKNSEIFPAIERMMEGKFLYEKKYRHTDNCVFWADYELQGKELTIGPARFDDRIKPCVRIMHSYNGTIRYRAVMGFQRQICSNGMWGYVFDTQIDLRHSTGNLDKIFAGTLEGVDKFLEQAETFKLKYDEMARRTVTNYKERIEQIIAVTVFPKRQYDFVVERVEKEHKEHRLPISDWLIYNAFNYQLNHNVDFTKDEAYRMKIDASIIKYINEGIVKDGKLVLA